MFRQKINVIGLCLTIAGFFVSAPAWSDGLPPKTDKTDAKMTVSEQISPKDILEIDENSEKDLAQADLVVMSLDNNADSQQKKESENVATVTAEGDFVVPTFMLQSVDKKENTPQKVEEEVYTNTVRQLPVVKITQTELIPVREQMAVERRLTGKTTKTTQLYKEALARSQVQLPAGTVLEPVADDSAASQQEAAAVLSGEIKPVKKKKLLLPLRELPKVPEKEEDLSGTEPLYTTYSSEVADKILSEMTNEESESLLMPQDIKVTFYPDSAEFSGQTVKWIKVFSMRARNDPRYTVEIRLSNQQPQLQQKRLYVIKRVLMNNGLSLHQIAVDYVNRPADSLILRMVKKEEDVQTRKTVLKNGQVKENKTINW